MAGPRYYLPIVVLLGGALTGALLAADPDATLRQRSEFFENHVRPLLADRCFECHDEETQESGLRLDSLQAMLDGGERGPAIQPGNAPASLMIHAVNHSGIELHMPEGDKLSAREIGYLTKWVDDGAIWPGEVAVERSPDGHETGQLFTAAEKAFWAFQTPRPPSIPEVNNAAWARSELDRFVLKQLEDHGLAPPPPASKRSLIRRAYFDLLGLPPTAEQVRAFLADDSPHAFAAVLDDLLASPRYGERWGRHWLDVARYADSNGLDENVAFEYIHKYRDWVIDSFNADLPYDEFVTHQLAGDLIPQRPGESADDYIHRVKAVGFLAVGPKMIADDDPKKKKMDLIDEQLNTVSQTFMGLTVGCARCHDHKFDPIPTWDYYAMASIFNSTQTLEHLGVVAPIVRLELKPEGYDQALAEYTSARGKLEADRQSILRVAAAPHLNSARDKFTEYLAAVADYGLFLEPDPSRDVIWEAEATQATAIDTAQLGGVTVIKGRSNPEYRIQIARAGKYALALRMANDKQQDQQLLLDGELLQQRGGFVSTGGRTEQHLRWIRHAIVTLDTGAHVLKLDRVNGLIDQLALTPVDGHAREIGSPASLAQQLGLDEAILVQWLDFIAGQEVNADSVWNRLRGQDLGHFATQLRRISSSEEVRRTLADEGGPLRIPDTAEKWIRDDQRQAWEALNRRITELDEEQPRLEFVMGVRDREPEDLRVSIRGNYLTPGAQTRRQFLRIIDGEEPTPLETQQSGRLELARWLTQPDHPLTARVIVNRVWRWRFGRGIVPTTDNFGKLGERPTHPELLDSLASTFVHVDHWSLKRLHRRIMLSSTYQMSTRFDQAAYDVDPTNRLWWRFPRRRLEAEAIRDALLHVSEQADLTMGGSLMPLQDKAYVTGTASTVHSYENTRRSVYQPIYRSAVYDVLTAFDFPDPATANGDRAESIVAPQALLLMNSPLVEQSAKRLAEQLLARDDTDAARLETLYWRVLSRSPDEAEVRAVSAFLAGASSTSERSQQWLSVCRALLASNEFLYLD